MLCAECRVLGAISPARRIIAVTWQVYGDLIILSAFDVIRCILCASLFLTQGRRLLRAGDFGSTGLYDGVWDGRFRHFRPLLRSVSEWAMNRHHHTTCLALPSSLPYSPAKPCRLLFFRFRGDLPKVGKLPRMAPLLIHLMRGNPF